MTELIFWCNCSPGASFDERGVAEAGQTTKVEGVASSLMSWVLGQNLFSSRTHVGAMESRCSVAEVYSLRPYLMSPLVQVVSPVLESALWRPVRSPAMERIFYCPCPSRCFRWVNGVPI
ncbi:UNVERIFIED_CONTAM: hypothetical protein Slati_4574400 [Sesamum latifolium]|uniref:Uncharacterized protein n=1 Tax=Sesamum latifolium TaxID=2727402 RepID=A0AAW2SHY1_9LAMI